SMHFGGLPHLARPAAARGAGFTAVEFWWPFDVPDPDADDVERFEHAIRRSGVQLIALNFYAGVHDAGDRGIAGAPDRTAEFQRNLDVVTGIGERLGCRL